MPDTTETIVIKWIVDAKDVLTKYEAVKKATAEIKAQMQEMAQKTGASLKELSTLMENAFKKDIQTRFPLGGKEAEDALNTYKLAMTSAVNQIKSEAAQEARVIKETQQQERDARRQTAKSLEADVRQQVAAMRQLESEAAKSGKGGGGIGGFIGNLFGGAGGGLGSILPQLLGIAGGIGIVTSQFRKFAAAVSDATQSGIEFARAMYSMEIGIRALQRTGVEITIQDAYEQLRILRKDFGIFTTKDLVVGSAAFFNLNRDMGFTKEQLFELQRAIATLAVVNSRSMDEVQKTVALALSSGYTEGLQRLGVSINRVTIAAEAASLGWKGGYTSLTEQQRALATYNLIIQKTSVYQKDLLEYQKTLPGILDKTTAAIEEQRNTLGSYLVGVKVLIEKLKLWWQTVFIMNGPLGSLARTIKVLGYLFENFGDIARNVAHRLKDFLPKGTLDNIYSFIVMFLQGMTQIREIIETVTTAILKMNDAVGTLIFGEEWPFFKKMLEDLRDIAKGLPVQEEMAGGNIKSTGNEEDYALRHRPTEEDLKALEAAQNQADAIAAIEEDAAEQRAENLLEHQRREAEIKEEHQRRLEEMALEHQRRLEELEIDHQRKLEDIQRDYAEKIADINLQVAEDMQDAQLQYEQDIEDAWRDYYNKVAEAAEDYRNKQLDAEEAYQEKMRKLREGFLFDLEDAIRVRDARQVLQLIRRYNLEKTQIDRDYEQQKARMAREYQQQLADLIRQRDERLRMLAEELQRRFEEILREAERERAKAEEDAIRAREDEQRRYDQRKADEKTRYDQDKADELARYYQDWADEQARYKQQEDDLQRHLDIRLQKIAKAIGDEIGYTATGVYAVTKAMNDTYGPGGNIQRILDFYVALVGARMAQASALMSGTNLNAPNINPTNPPRRRAQGGVDIANTATNVTFGEAGVPEFHLFMPLSKGMKDLGKSMSGFSGKNGSGKVAVEIMLSKDLEGRIIDTTMDTVADVIIRRLR